MAATATITVAIATAGTATAGTTATAESHYGVVATRWVRGLTPTTGWGPGLRED